MNYPLNIL